MLCKVRKQITHGRKEKMSENPFQNKIDIAVIKRDIETIRKSYEQSSQSISRLEQVVLDISKNSITHEQRLISQEKLIAEVDTGFERQRQENVCEIQKLHNKVNAINAELTNKIAQTERTILGEMQQLKNDLSKKITEIDMYRYMVMGGIAVIVFLLSKAVDVAKIFS